jgi:hypothetical protein
MLFKRALTGQEIDSLYKGYYYGNSPVEDYNLVAYWPFDSASGRLYNDVTGHGYNALSSAALGCSPGIYGTAINLPAQNFELVAQNSRDAFYLPAFSVELWFSVNNDPTTMLDVGQYLFDYQSVQLGVRNGYGFYVDPQGHVNWTMAAANGSFWSQLPSTTVIKPGTWYHVVAIYTGSQLQLFINGVLEGTVNHVGGYPKSTYDARIGCQRLTDGTLRCFLNGKIDDVKLFNRVLDKEEVLAHYAKNQRVPVLIPFPGNQTADRRPEFRWHGVPSASVYTISISSTPDFLAPMFYVPEYDTFFRPLVNLSMEKLFWRVKSNLSDQWSKVDTFLVAAPVSAAAPAAQGFVPLNAFFNVNVSAGQKYKVMVFAPSGREVSSFDVAEENGNIAGQIKSLRLPSGCYLLALKTNNNIISSTKYLLK